MAHNCLKPAASCEEVQSDLKFKIRHMLHAFHNSYLLCKFKTL